jgi:hypothetical protein
MVAREKASEATTDPTTREVRTLKRAQLAFIGAGARVERFRFARKRCGHLCDGLQCDWGLWYGVNQNCRLRIPEEGKNRAGVSKDSRFQNNNE